MSKSILDFTSINGRSGTEFTQVKGRSGTVFWCKPYILTLSSKPTGVDTITCYRYSSLQPGAATGPSAVLTNGSTIYHGDVIYISATASSGYKAPSISSSTGTITSNMLPVDGNESITVTAGELDVAPVYITAGTGVSSVFLSTNYDATSGSASGSNFNIGDTVYGFAVLQTGYNPPDGWIPVSGAIFRVDSGMTVAVSGNDFGTQNGSLKSFTITFSKGGKSAGSWGSSSKIAYYGDTLTRSGNTVTCSGTASWTNTFTPGTPYNVSYNSITSPVTSAQTITATTSVKSYTLSRTSSVTGASITCYRYSSQYQGASTGTSATLANGATIYYGDEIYISASASTGYNAPSVSSSTGTISSNKLAVDGNETITVTAGSLKKFTVTFTNPSNGYWYPSSGKITNVSYGATVSVSGNTVTINGISKTLYPNSTGVTTSNYYAVSWVGTYNGDTITGNRTITGSIDSKNKPYGIRFKVSFAYANPLYHYTFRNDTVSGRTGKSVYWTASVYYNQQSGNLNANSTYDHVTGYSSTAFTVTLSFGGAEYTLSVSAKGSAEVYLYST